MANRRKRTTRTVPELAPGSEPRSTVQPPHTVEPRRRAPEVEEPVTPREGYPEAARDAARDTLAAQETHMEEIAETGAPYIGPPPSTTAPTVRRRERSRLGGPEDGQQTPPTAQTGGDLAPAPAARPTRRKSRAKLTPEGLEADTTSSPGERIRRRASH
ncbi:MAG: hypothetical protein ACYDCO_03550 [Armatimonadota bacterium]